MIAIDVVSGTRLGYGRRHLLDSSNQAELRECGNAIVKSNLFDDLAVP
jgi:hypothetical protein